MARQFFVAGAIAGFIGVILSAFAAHGLKDFLTSEFLHTFKTGVNYQLLHAPVLILIAFAANLKPEEKDFVVSGWALLTGTILFSCSLYLYALTGMKLFTVATPMGGVAFLLGWGYLIKGARKVF